MVDIILVALTSDNVSWIVASQGAYAGRWRLFTWNETVYQVVSNPGGENELCHGAVLKVPPDELHLIEYARDLIRLVNPYAEES